MRKDSRIMNSERKDLRRLKSVIVTAIVCIIAVSFFTVTAFATEGFGLFSRSRNIALTITSAEDWDAFADSVLSGNTYAGKTVKLSADITVTRGIGSADITTGQQNPTFAFSGTFDGDGHVLTFLPPAEANALYEHFASLMSERVRHVGCGVFGASMKIDMSADGPVTIVMDSDCLKKKERER